MYILRQISTNLVVFASLYRSGYIEMKIALKKRIRAYEKIFASERKTFDRKYLFIIESHIKKYPPLQIIDKSVLTNVYLSYTKMNYRKNSRYQKHKNITKVYQKITTKFISCSPSSQRYS